MSVKVGGRYVRWLGARDPISQLLVSAARGVAARGGRGRRVNAVR